MSEKKQKVPKLRFPGFTGNWEQRKLSDFTERVVRKNGAESDRPLTISAQDGLIDQREYFNRQVASKDMSNYYLIKNGEFAYNKSYSEGYPFGAVKRLDYYESGALSTLYIVFKLIDTNVLSDFIIAYYMTHLWYGEISKRASEGARNHGLLNISPADFFQSEMLIPTNVNEQCLIGKFFENFDNLITLHQRKLENLKLKKKALLQKLFPKNGEQFPELRFPGFTDAWEQRKFSEITVNIGKRNKDNLNLEPYAITKDDGFIPQADAHDEFGYMKETDRRAYNIVKPNSFGYNPARINVGSIGYYSGSEDIIVSSLYEIFQTSDNIYDRFLWHWFKSKQFQNWIERLQEGSVRLYFYYDKLCECEIFIPTVDEQIKIGNSLDRLDNLITLHQRKLEHLQLQKKALLQQMFV